MTNSPERHLTRTAVFVILERDEQIFFLRRFNTGWADGLLTLPAGHVDQGQSVRAAAVTEAKEEALVDIKEEDLEFVHVDYRLDRYTNFYFKARRWEGEPALGEPHAASEALWVPKNDLPNDLTPQLQNLFIQIEKGEWFSDLPDEPM